MAYPLGNFTNRPPKLPKERIKVNPNGHIFLGDKVIDIGGYEWMPMLDEIESFSYRGVTIRKESRKGWQYWYAFKKVNGKVRKIYCGAKYDFCRISYFESLYDKFQAMTKK